MNDRDTEDMDSRTESEGIENFGENSRNDTGLDASLEVFLSVPEEVNMGYFRRLEEEARILT